MWKLLHILIDIKRASSSITSTLILITLLKVPRACTGLRVLVDGVDQISDRN